MPKYAVLLRAVNLGGVRRVPMATWAARLTELGYRDVRTYLQSGQAVVNSRNRSAAVAKQVHDDLRTVLGVDTAVLVRTHAQLREVVAACPWPDAAARDPTHVHAMFVDVTPAKGWLLTDADKYLPERAVLGPGVVYLLFPNGAGRSKMPTSSIEGTARNWRTVLKLLELTS